MASNKLAYSDRRPREVIIRNIGKMMAQKAPPEDIGEYILSEGYDPETEFTFWKPQQKPGFMGRVKRGLLDVGEGINLGAMEAVEGMQKMVGMEPAGLADKYRQTAEERIAQYEAARGPGVDIPRDLGRAAPWMMVPAGTSGKVLEAGGTMIGKNVVGRGLAEAGKFVAKSPVLDSAIMGTVQGASMIPGTGETRTGNALLGGLGGAAGGAFAKLMSSATTAGTTPARAELAKQARAKGFDVTPAMATQGRIASNVEGALDVMPFTAGSMQSIYTANQKQANKIASMAIGEMGEANLTDDVLRAAEDRIGKEFSRLASSQKVHLDANFFADVATAKQTQTKVLLKELQDEKAKKVIESILRMPQGVKLSITGEQYQATRSALSNAANDAFRGNNSNLGRALKEVRNAFDDAAYRSAPNKDAWLAARQQWAAWKALTKPGVVEAGDVSLPKLASAVRGKNPAAWATGKTDELGELAKLSPVLKTRLPNSATAERSAYINAATMGLPIALGGAGAGYMAGGAGGAGAGGLLGALAAPKLLEMAYLNPVTRKAIEGGISQKNSALLAPWLIGAGRAVGAPYAIDVMQQ